MNRTMTVAVLGMGVLALGGCATYDPYGRPYAVYEAPGPVVRGPAPVYAQNVEYGVVERIEMYRGGNNSPVNVGTIVGGLAGGLLGHQIGAGRGNTAATIAGAVGGAVVGNQVEQRNRQGGTAYQIGVRLDNGTYQTFTQESIGDMNIGNRVRIDNGRVYRY